MPTTLKNKRRTFPELKIKCPREKLAPAMLQKARREPVRKTRTVAGARTVSMDSMARRQESCGVSVPARRSLAGGIRSRGVSAVSPEVGKALQRLTLASSGDGHTTSSVFL